MLKTITHIAILCIPILFLSCQKDERTRAEGVYRRRGEYLFATSPPLPRTSPTYPWEGDKKITKEFFRCRGSSSHPVVKHTREGKEPLIYRDCAGGGRHGLPLKDGKEFIYPCLIDILNDIQEKTGKNIVITTGHRCPQHNVYSDQSVQNRASKHQLGAEVDFYVEGMEDEPWAIVLLIQEHYPNDSFTRYIKEGLNVSTPPWINEEILVKLYQAHEGRDFDNRHPFPYIGIQVRSAAFNEARAQNFLR